MLTKIFFFSVIAGLFCLPTHAQNAKLKIDSKKPIRLIYSSKAWNKHPHEIDTGILVFRDAETGRIACIEAIETSENSGVFSETSQISWGQNSELTPEIYLAPSGTQTGQGRSQKIENMIDDGVLLRKPYFLKPDDKKTVTITVFDSREQALAAFDEYRKQAQGKNIVDPAALEAQEKARLEQEQAAQALLAKTVDAERASLAIAEAKKQADLKKAQDNLSAAEKAKKQKLAKNLAERALELYKKEDYKGAEEAFAKAIEMDPSNKNFYYQYGVTLYKTENYNKSLVILNAADGPDVNVAEKEYYQALNLMKLKEFDGASEKLKSVRDKGDKVLGPSSAFLLGVIDYQRENYDAAKKHFEYVLDNSSDPALDKQADAYIEQIANVMAFKKEQEKKFLYTFNLGLMYDSNILAVSNSTIDAGTPTDLAGYRAMYGGSIEYRPVYNAKHEFSALLSASDMYSMNQSFKAEPSFQNTDPMIINLGFPYKLKGTAFQKPYQLGITPAYETIMMNADGSGARETIVNSLVLKIDQTFVMNEDWFSNYLLEIRSDDSQLAATGADDQTAKKITLGTTNTFFRDKKKTEAIIGEFGISDNLADGDNQDFLRFDLAGSYMAPWRWDTSWTARLGYYNANYPNHQTGRKDDNIGLNLGLRKPITQTFSVMVNGAYTINKSTLDSSDYKKYLIMTMLSWNGVL